MTGFVRNWIWVIILVSTAVVVWAKDGQQRIPALPKKPIHIRSNSLKVLQKEKRAVFWGQVKAVKDDLVIQGDRLEVFYRSRAGDQNPGQDIRSMVFTGSVSIEQGKRRGHCERAEYNGDSAKLTCLGNPWVTEGDSRIRGQEIVYLLERDEVRVVKPRAVIHLEEQKTKRKRVGR